MAVRTPEQQAKFKEAIMVTTSRLEPKETIMTAMIDVTADKLMYTKATLDLHHRYTHLIEIFSSIETATNLVSLSSLMDEWMGVWYDTRNCISTRQLPHPEG